MNDKYVLVSMDDEKIKEISEIFGNKTCKKIIDYLSDNNESSEKDLSDSLKLPINTVEYNLKKLLKAKLIEKTSNFFWSKKGKKIVLYKLSNKSIVISPKGSNVSKLKSILPVALISFAGALFVRFFYSFKKTVNTSQSFLMESTKVASDNVMTFAEESVRSVGEQATGDGANVLLSSPSPVWLWFLGGVLFAIIIFSILNWRKL